MIKYLKKAVQIINKDGIGSVWKKTKLFLFRFAAIEKLKKETGLNWSFFDSNLEVTPYDSNYQENEDFSVCNSTVKPIAFYLPQFHRVKENDEWWGEGFTEWTNTRKGSPQYEGHYQPRKPHQDFGYYDLTDIHTIEKQVKLAKMHGIFGFCFYYYWFSGRRILEKPVDLFLDHPEIDMPFCLCWANENFTRNWDGQKKEILLKQNYTEEDRNQFIVDLLPYIKDPRYIRIDNKPVILVYNPTEIPEINITFNNWRETARKIGLGEILIWVCRTAGQTAQSLRIEKLVDGEVEFPPHNILYDMLSVSQIQQESQGFIFNYRKVVEFYESLHHIEQNGDLPLYHTCMMGWDNTARRRRDWTSYYGYSLKNFYRWTANIVNDAKKRKKEKNRFVFINAWNEWAEGTYLEPDEKYGYANINTFSKALFGIPFDSVKRLEGETDFLSSLQKKTLIAVQVHLYYLDCLEQIIEELNCIPYPFDVYISTDTEEKCEKIKKAFRVKSRAEEIIVDVYENRGRDVRPFLIQMKSVYRDYRYIGHIHSKKTINGDYGSTWCQYLYKNLLDSEENINEILTLFEENEKIGIVFPEDYPVISSQVEWGGNADACKVLLNKLGISCTLELEPVFPAGNMFWARTSAIGRVFDRFDKIDSFPYEAGQFNQTLAHQIERIWCYLVRNEGFIHQKIYNAHRKNVELKPKKRLAIFAHYDKEDRISKEDESFISSLVLCVEDVIFVSNSAINEKELNKIENYVSKVVIRKNEGYDFGAWREVLLSIDPCERMQYDALYLINNSNQYVNGNLKNVIRIMEDKDIDFWGITLFPYCRNGSFIGEQCIKEHIQSYFQCFNQSVLQSEEFWGFWEDMVLTNDWNEVIKKYETKLTDYLVQKGFKYDCYIQETKQLSSALSSYSIPYDHPSALLLLDSPFIKKKALCSMSAVEEIRVNDILGKY